MEKVSEIELSPGDSVLLKSGDVFTDSLVLNDVNGTSDEPITISTYGGREKAIITGSNSEALDDLCIQLNNATNTTIKNLSLNNAAYGIRLYYTAAAIGENVTVDSCDFSGIKGIFWGSESQVFTQHSAGIVVNGYVAKDTSWSDALVKNFTIKNCFCTASAGLFGASAIYEDGFADNDVNVRRNFSSVKGFLMENCTMKENEFYGTKIGSVGNGVIRNCTFTGNGTKEMSVGSAAILLASVNNFTITGCVIEEQNRLLYNPDGCGIDLEANCHNVTISECTIKNNDGVGIMVYDNGEQHIWNTNLTVINNVFKYNSRNAYGNVKNAEIYIVEDCLKGTENKISGNSYSLWEGVSFINDYVCPEGAALIVENNTVITN